MKQLQWDKIPMQQAEKTVFKEPSNEDEWVKKLQLDGVWTEMEEDFKAKQLVINLMGVSISSLFGFICVRALISLHSKAEAGGTQVRARPTDQEASR